MLPDSLPEGDPSSFALPVYLAEPISTYTSREVAGTLKCKVAHALRVYFVCNDEVMKSTTSEEGVDVKSGSKFQYITLDVKRSQVMDILGEFSCKCYASSSQGQVVSRGAIVDVACKYFSTFLPSVCQKFDGPRKRLPPRSDPDTVTVVLVYNY